MFKGVKQVYLFCGDVDGSARWYEQLLQIRQVEAEVVPGQFALIRVADIELCFHLAGDKSPVSTGGCVAYWAVDNLDETLRRATELGGVIYRGPIQVHDEPRWMAQIKDPFGNVVGVESSVRS